MVATPRHRANFESGLTGLGFDLVTLRDTNRVVLRDARETLAGLLVDGRPDPGRFEFIGGGLVRDALSRGAPVHVYGEMVDLLWEAGDVTQTLELEALWNELGRTLPFSLLCGYRVDTAAGPLEKSALKDVCSAHSAVINPPAELARVLDRGTVGRGPRVG